MATSNDLAQFVRNQQEKLSYYIIGLAVAAMGFAIHMTIGLPLSYSQIPLGIAVLCWGLSISVGLTHLKTTIFTYKLNVDTMTVKQMASIEPSGEALDLLLEYADKFDEESKLLGKKLLPQFNRINVYFKAGVFFFVMWRLLEMYLIQ